jgi:hypothetical protein
MGRIKPWRSNRRNNIGIIFIGCFSPEGLLRRQCRAGFIDTAIGAMVLVAGEDSTLAAGTEKFYRRIFV